MKSSQCESAAVGGAPSVEPRHDTLQMACGLVRADSIGLTHIGHGASEVTVSLGRERIGAIEVNCWFFFVDSAITNEDPADGCILLVVPSKSLDDARHAV